MVARRCAGGPHCTGRSARRRSSPTRPRCCSDRPSPDSTCSWSGKEHFTAGTGTGTAWSWRSYGAPPNASLFHESPAVVTYLEDDGLTRRIVAYGRDTDGELHKMSNAGSEITWTFLGHPLNPNNPNAVFLAGGADAVTFTEDGVRHTYVCPGQN